MLHQVSQEFNGAVNLSWSPRRQGAAIKVAVSFDTAPTTAGDVEVRFDSGDGANYDVLFENDDPSQSPAVTDLVFLSGNAMPLVGTDAVRVEYANPDSRRVNVTIFGSDDFV